MKKILLSAAAVAVTAQAGTKEEIAALKAQMAQLMQKIEKLESKEKAQAPVATHAPKSTTVGSKALKLKFSGQHFLHFLHDDKGGNKTDKFGISRNYLQVKAYFADDPKSYMRVTLDAKQNSNFDKGSLDVRVKYAYLYLDSVLPYTGVEIGLAHTPWLDYEEHHGWWYRSISETFLEQGNGAHFQNSSDYGINFKTKTDYFSSELGLFNGAGYHGIEDGKGLRGEWRLTAHLLGTGKKHVHKSDTYADLSFLGSYGKHDAGAGDASGTYAWYGLHGVYNQPEFLIAGSYLKASKAAAKTQGHGWSINGEFRLAALDAALAPWNLLARYDDYKLDSGVEKKTTFAGVAYRYNKYVEFIADYQKNEKSATPTDKRFLLSAEIDW